MVTAQESAAINLKGCFFYCGEKQTASLSSHQSAAQLIPRFGSALYRLFLQGWSPASYQNPSEIGFTGSV